MFVAAEFHRRGGYAVTFAGNMPGIDILASDLADTRRISIQVKTKSSGSWHARFPKDAAQCGEDPAETSYWVFVDLGGEHPAYFIAPRWWVCDLGGEVDQLADRESRPRRVCGDRPDAIVRRGAGDVHVSTASFRR
jgi:hypothetical protein